MKSEMLTIRVLCNLFLLKISYSLEFDSKLGKRGINISEGTIAWPFSW